MFEQKEWGEEGVCTFASKKKPELKITYQRTYKTGWFDHEGKEMTGTPDITIEYSGKPLLVLDAKNSTYSRGGYLEQMINYLQIQGCDTGVFIHSDPPEGFWLHYFSKNKKVFYTHLTPIGVNFGDEKGYNKTNLDRIVDLTKNKLAYAH